MAIDPKYHGAVHTVYESIDAMAKAIDQAVLPHDSGNTVFAACLTDLAQVTQNSTRSIHPSTGSPGVANQRQQSGIFLGVIRFGAV